jgi:hypothetical protein
MSRLKTKYAIKDVRNVLFSDIFRSVQFGVGMTYRWDEMLGPKCGRVFSYYTEVARYYPAPNVVILSRKNFSQTTAGHKSEVRAAAIRSGAEVVYYPYEHCRGEAFDLSPEGLKCILDSQHVDLLSNAANIGRCGHPRYAVEDRILAQMSRYRQFANAVRRVAFHPPPDEPEVWHVLEHTARMFQDSPPKVLSAALRAAIPELSHLTARKPKPCTTPHSMLPKL